MAAELARDLAGKVAVITGGSSGIGKGMAEKFAAEGAAVVIADIVDDRGEAVAAELNDQGGTALFVHTDVAEPAQIGRLVAATVDTFGGLDIMVNNAGISGTMHRKFLEDDLADFHKVLSVNLLGVMAGTRDAGRHMSTHGGGSIINLTSIGGIQAGGGVQTYRASKAAVIQFTKSAAIELAYYGIRVNAIAPGNIPTPLLKSSASDENRAAVEEFEAGIRQTMRDDRPLKREGTAEDVAEAALYFASDKSRYVTGTVLPIDGGTVAGKVIRSSGKPIPAN
ncbi:SDR family NAD(P)-dependent oxidoreductase [Mycolicibacterium komossense]|uniref:SDR family oxidoreductase n=1 Tax=Mycolicibacterium komossense TaxID=1779 RepID=A0ABT3CI22_9MYCO|nr:SDR family oxidoreductase [Mycolicibacterium komossense]MCV7229002.1 SDR family oxidoreductase [Mycolicibacterium komossense]